jgi:hypothetical protein
LVYVPLCSLEGEHQSECPEEGGYNFLQKAGVSVLYSTASQPRKQAVFIDTVDQYVKRGGGSIYYLSEIIRAIDKL